MSKTKNISLTIDEELLAYVDELASINDRSRSSMISWMIRQQYDQDVSLDKEAESYESNYSA
jgi:metal-responsive CopG/Arc/MetJ family transcriptional regulator